MVSKARALTSVLEYKGLSFNGRTPGWQSGNWGSIPHGSTNLWENLL
jgi:hypothetical protein